MYRIFGVAIDSELELPELPEGALPTGSDVYRFRLEGSSAEQRASEELSSTHDPTPAGWLHDWPDSGGNVILRVGRFDERYLLRFPGLADFTIDLEGRLVVAYPEIGTAESTLRHLFLDQVMPRILGQQGEIVLHAGAVTLADGKTVAFVGETGCGKSTLASSLERKGARLITDDCLMIALRHDLAYVVPNYAGVRLFEDSIRAIYGEKRAMAEVAQYTSKRRVLIHGNVSDQEEEAIALDALFLLATPGQSGKSGVRVSPAGGSAALMAFVAQCFVLDPTDITLMARLFHATAGLFQAGLRCYELDYPRSFASLDAVSACIHDSISH